MFKLSLVHSKKKQVYSKQFKSVLSNAVMWKKDVKKKYG